jgi:hypothetical protein
MLGAVDQKAALRVCLCGQELHQSSGYNCDGEDSHADPLFGQYMRHSFASGALK